MDSDQELIAAAQKGDNDAFAELVRRHHAGVAALCRSMLGDDAAADDAAQDVFLKTYRALKGFRGDAKLSTWLYRVATNRCLDLVRSQGRAKTQSLDALLEDEGARVEALIAREGPERPAADADLVARVLAALPETYRSILTLREVNGLTYDELCETLDCTLDAVKARLRRARLEFAEKLRHIEGTGRV